MEKHASWSQHVTQLKELTCLYTELTNMNITLLIYK